MTRPRYSHVLMVTGARTFTGEANRTRMQAAFARLWDEWGPSSVTSPLLISGNCPEGADAMAEQLFAEAGLEICRMPADWSRYGPKAGPIRNEEMVATTMHLASQGSRVAALAFLDLCKKKGCPQAGQQQLMDAVPGHYSHGTVHARSCALAAGIPVTDVMEDQLPPF